MEGFAEGSVLRVEGDASVFSGKVQLVDAALWLKTARSAPPISVPSTSDSLVNIWKYDWEDL